MRDRLIRFDTVLAAVALLMSSISAGAMVYQTHVIEEQFSAATWPYLNLTIDHSNKDFQVSLVNEGLGPALVRSARLELDGKLVPGWGQVADRLGSLKVETIGSASVDSSTTLRAGESRRLFRVITTNRRALDLINMQRFILHFCYCSIGQRCWVLNDGPGANAASTPELVARCPSTGQIEAQSVPVY